MARSGTYEMTLVGGTQSEEIRFDAGASEVGWNDLGTWDLAAGEVRVELARQSDGPIVVADAIRWLPLDATPEAPNASESAGGGNE